MTFTPYPCENMEEAKRRLMKIAARRRAMPVGLREAA